MVHCIKCGLENPDDSKFCSRCGNSLYPGEPSVRREEGFVRRMRERDDCFGVSGGLWAIIIGLAIVLWGVSEIMRMYSGFTIPWWPIIVIIIGIFILVRAYSRRM